MQIMGTAVDQAGNDYYKVKNSWGVRPPYDGYYYFSRPFVAYKTMSVMVNKKAIPAPIRKKIGGERFDRSLFRCADPQFRPARIPRNAGPPVWRSSIRTQCSGAWNRYRF